jgi:hypothetical protein
LGAFVGTGTLAQLETTIGRKLAITHACRMKITGAPRLGIT